MDNQIDPQTEKAIYSFMSEAIRYYALADAILFGSRARHTNRPDSDVDLAVLLRGSPGKFIATKLFMDDIAYDVLLATGIRIQPLPIWEEQWKHPEHYSNPRLLENIRREGIRV